MRSLEFPRLVGLDDASEEAFDGIEKVSLRHDSLFLSGERIESRVAVKSFGGN